MEVRHGVKRWVDDIAASSALKIQATLIARLVNDPPDSFVSNLDLSDFFMSTSEF